MPKEYEISDDQEKLDEVYGESLGEPAQRGDKKTGEIVSFSTGQAQDYFENPKSDPEKKMIQFLVETPDGYTVKITGALSMHPMAKFRQLHDLLGHKPKIGDRVPLEYDGQFWQPRL